MAYDCCLRQSDDKSIEYLKDNFEKIVDQMARNYAMQVHSIDKKYKSEIETLKGEIRQYQMDNDRLNKLVKQLKRQDDKHVAM